MPSAEAESALWASSETLASKACSRKCTARVLSPTVTQPCQACTCNQNHHCKSSMWGSLPCLRPAHHIDSKGLRSGIDLRRIPRKMLETPASHKDEPDAWIFMECKPCLPSPTSA